MNESIKYIGLDVHKETIAVSVAQGQRDEVRYLGAIWVRSPTHLRR
jgi:hypothetical protein